MSCTVGFQQDKEEVITPSAFSNFESSSIGKTFTFIKSKTSECMERIECGLSAVEICIVVNSII